MELLAQNIIDLSQKRLKLKQNRAALVRESRLIRKQIYNFSLKINAIEEEIDALLISTEV